MMGLKKSITNIVSVQIFSSGPLQLIFMIGCNEYVVLFLKFTVFYNNCGYTFSAVTVVNLTSKVSAITVVKWEWGFFPILSAKQHKNL